MKRLLVLFLGLLLVMSFSGCNVLSSADSDNLDFHENAAYDSDITDLDNDLFIFTWLSFTELAVDDECQSSVAYEKRTRELFSKMKNMGVTDCFVQVRPFCDALYDSELFPKSVYAEKAVDFDVLRVVTQTAKDYAINCHGWINPYRISYESEGVTDNFAVKKVAEKDKTAIIETPSGTFFNPSSQAVRSLIISGVRELMENYSLKGIHIDDYFYPADIKNQDKASYEKYRKSGGSLSLDNWRRENVTTLIKSLCLVVKTYGEEKLFSISPSGSIEDNYNKLYADVEYWADSPECCDIILPQLYFGFENEKMPFEKCLEQWLDLTEDRSRLMPGLALYKVGQYDKYALSGSKEWQKNSDILKRQVSLIKKSCGGFGLYSASYINFSEIFLSRELNNLKSVL